MFRKNKVSVNTKEAAAEVFQKLDAVGCDPIAELARMAMDNNTPFETRVGILKDLAGYTAPKRKAVDVNTSNDAGLVVKVVQYSKGTAQLEKMMDPVEVEKERRANGYYDGLEGEGFEDGEQEQGKEAEEATG